VCPYAPAPLEDELDDDDVELELLDELEELELLEDDELELLLEELEELELLDELELLASQSPRSVYQPQLGQ
jgi:hypothetical protein